MTPPQYESETLAPIQSPAVHRLQEAQYMHSVRAGVAVPLLQAIVTGALVALLTGTLFYIAKSDVFIEASVIMFCLSVLAQWLLGQLLWRRIVRLVEREFQIDINRDGVIEPREAPQTIRVEVTQDNGGGFMQTNYIDLPFADRLPQLAAGLIDGQKFTVERWVGRSKDKLFTPAEFIELRDAMIEHDWLRPNNPRDITRGYSLTKTGAQVMERLANPYPTPAASRK